MPLTLAQKSDVRRHLGYNVIGIPVTNSAGASLGSGNAGYRYFEVWGQLEYRLNNLNADEEARLTGNAYGALAMAGQNPNPGDTISVTFTGGGLSAPVTVQVAAVAGMTVLQFLNSLGSAVSVNQALSNAGFMTVLPYGTGVYAQNAAPLAEIASINPVAFTMAVASSGVTAVQITANGALLSPAGSLDGGQTTTYGYLPILNGLEGALVGASDNLDTQQADVWKARMNELGQRQSLLMRWRMDLANFLGLPLNRMRFQRMTGPRASSLA